ncbi:Rossmann-fold protein [Giardia lamblia P15]|uniref:Ribosomal RNA-processing protein 8 n=1 Tax=Giardia intestinalis (strain P15) TaxID=658858 RepID=E1F7V9_GIAIA|nr:Rossmann-fold protein [Giardia lamblia P15]
MPRPRSISMKHGSVTRRLAGSRFRVLNEAFYTESSLQTQERLRINPAEFMDYHRGYQEQVSKWEVNPIALFIDLLERILAGDTESGDGFATMAGASSTNSVGIGLLDAELVQNLQDLEVRHPTKFSKVDKHQIFPSFTGLTREDIRAIGDMGCGEAALAKAIATKYSPGVAVHSFDLVALNSHVTVANIRALPLERHALDLAVYCLSLMGSDYVSFIKEAFRVVRPGGELWLAEVNSRITNTKHLIELFSACSFRKIKVIPFTHFTLISFRRLEDLEEGHPSEKKRADVKKYENCLTPCIYKKR